MERGFKKISYEQFYKDTGYDKDTYEDIKIPIRATHHSAGYDFSTPVDFTIKVNESYKIATGIKVYMMEDEVLKIYIRSSLGFKYNIRLCNQVGIVDSDYYNNNDNEGHLFIKIKNEGDKDISFKKGDRIAQGIFLKYLITDDDTTFSVRNSGIGSTNK